MARRRAGHRPARRRDAPSSSSSAGAASRHVAGEQLALRRAVALADGQRRHLGPEQQPPAELDEPLRRLAPPRQLGRPVVPHHPSRLGIDAEEQDQPSTLSRRDRAGLVLQGRTVARSRRPAVERTISRWRRARRTSWRVIVRCEGSAAPASPAARARSGRDGGLQVAGIGVDVRRQVGESHACPQFARASRRGPRGAPR